MAFKTIFTTGISGVPYSLVGGDFNGDRIQDFAVANDQGNVFSFKGDNSGNFTTLFDTLAFAGRTAITATDFNKDKRQDLAAVNEQGDVFIYKGSDKSNFVYGGTFKVSSTPISVAAADFNGDGIPDVAVARDNGNVSLLLGDSSGNLTSLPDTLAFAGRPFLTAADFNNDGIQDLAAATDQGDVFIYRGSKTNNLVYGGTFKVSSPLISAIAADFNNDGIADLAVATNQGNVLIYQGRGNGSFDYTSNVFVGTGLRAVTAADFNDDGYQDLAVAGDFGVSVLLNNPSQESSLIPSRLTNSLDDVFKITGDANLNSKATLKITLTERNSQLLNEFGVFSVDDDKGTINGLAPGAVGYVQAALERTKVIFSVIANSPNGFDANNLTSLLELNSGDNLRFVLVKNSTFDAVRTGVTPSSELLFSGVNTQKITSLGDNSFSLAWQDGSGNSVNEFKSLVVKIQQTNETLPLGTSLQGQFQGEVLDLRAVTQTVKAEFSVHRESQFNNYVGFYRVANANGGIDTNGDGVSDLLPGQAGYIQAAVRGRVGGIDLAVSNQGTAKYTGVFAPGSIFAPFIVINGTPDALLDNNVSNDPAVYFPYLGANSDKLDHIRLLGNNVFGFEDLPNGGDRDFNDLVVKVNLTLTATT